MSISPSSEICRDSRISEDVICSLARLIGDPDKARARAGRLASLMNQIEREDCEGEVEVFKAAADPCRLRILKLLKEGELCVCEIICRPCAL